MNPGGELVWERSHDEHLYLWPLTGHDIAPHPLNMYASTADGLRYEGIRADIEARLRPGSDPAFLAMLSPLAEPTLRVTICGGANYCEPTVRVLAGLQVGGDLRYPGRFRFAPPARTSVNAAAIAVQTERSVHYWSGPEQRLAAVLSEVISPVTAGRVPTAIATRRDVAGGGEFRLHDTWDPPPHLVIAQLLAAKRGLDITITVEIPDSGAEPVSCTLIELPGDGFYLIFREPQYIRAVPADPEAIGKVIRDALTRLAGGLLSR